MGSSIYPMRFTSFRFQIKRVETHTQDLYVLLIPIVMFFICILSLNVRSSNTHRCCDELCICALYLLSVYAARSALSAFGHTQQQSAVIQNVIIIIIMYWPDRFLLTITIYICILVLLLLLCHLNIFIIWTVFVQAGGVRAYNRLIPPNEKKSSCNKIYICFSLLAYSSRLSSTLKFVICSIIHPSIRLFVRS